LRPLIASMATLALNSGLWVRRLLISGSPDQGRCRASEVNDGASPEKPVHLNLGVADGSEEIASNNSRIATANTITLLAAVPVSTDIYHRAYNLNPGRIEANITRRTQNMILVSVYEQTADFTAFNAIAERHRLHVIGDDRKLCGSSTQPPGLGSQHKRHRFFFEATRRLWQWRQVLH